MAAEDNPNREIGSTTVTSNELFDFIRGDSTEQAEPEVKVAPSNENVLQEQEPEVTIQDEVETPRDEVRTGERSSSSDSNDNLSRALAAINRLTEENQSLRRPPEAEPQVEMVEFAPGVRLPKDKSSWPLKVTPEVLKAVGIDPEISEGMNILGNALFMLAVNASAHGAATAFENVQSQRNAVDAHRRAFYTAYEDLKGAEDIVQNTERLARERGLHNRGLTDAEYAAEIAINARARLANLRGMDLPTYMKTFASKTSQSTRQPSRARFGGGSARAPRVRDTNMNDREMQDMLG